GEGAARGRATAAAQAARGRSSARARPSRDGLGSRQVGHGGSRTRRRASPTLVGRPPVPARSGAGGPAGERARGIETKNSAVLAQLLRSGGGHCFFRVRSLCR